MVATQPAHDELVATMTGGMVPTVEPFAGSERLRPDGRPRPELMAELRRIPNLANAWTCVAAILMPVALVAAFVAIGNWLALIVAIPLMGVMQNRMFILHHEGSHRSLFSHRRVNDVIGINFFGWVAFGTGTHGYRRGHSNHHRDEFGPKEPDFLLYSFYPIKQESFRRKLVRDATGVSAWRILKPRLTGITNAKYRKNSLRFYGGQAVIFSLFLVAGQPLLYLLLWVAPYVFVYQVLNRLRAIAEHGGLSRSDDRRHASHHVRQTLLARAIFVPVGVGRHLAHHVDSGIPFRNLARFEAILEEDGYITPEITWPSYRSLWRALASG